jgi:prolyl-tRNA synthetase
VFSFPALGAKVLHGIESIFADHFRAIGGSEYIFPIIQPISLWKNSGRVDRFGSTMFPIGEFVISPSNEEAAVALFGSERTFVYSMGHYCRNEIRPKNGLLRSKEFLLFSGIAISENVLEHNEKFFAIRKVIEQSLVEMGIPSIPVRFQTKDEVEPSQEFALSLPNIGEMRIGKCLECDLTVRASTSTCPRCNRELEIIRGVEVADIVRNGSHYHCDENHPALMLSFGIGITKLLGALIERSGQGGPFVWPERISPYEAIVVTKENHFCLETLRSDDSILVDDRDLSVGRRVKEAEWFGAPRIAICHGDGLELIDRIVGERVNRISLEQMYSRIK